MTENQWIPVSDPPKESGEYIVCGRGMAVHTDQWDVEEQRWVEAEHWAATVTHWQPMPEPAAV